MLLLAREGPPKIAVATAIRGGIVRPKTAMTNAFAFTDAELGLRLLNFEDQFVERKTFGDDRDWLRVVVSFANSAPIGFPCILFIGVTDAGDLQEGTTNLETLQSKLNKRLATAYPRIPYFQKVISQVDKQALAIIVPGSELRPHFSGPPYIRRGAHTHEMSQEEYRESLAYLNSKAARILEYKGQEVTVFNVRVSDAYESRWASGTTIAYCDRHYVTIQQISGAQSSFSLERVRLTFDDENRRLKLEILSGGPRHW